MKILVVNCGSSSLKYQLIDMDTEKILGKGLVERIGLDPDMPDHNKAIKKAFQNLHDQKVIEDISEIDAVGHRFVNGSEKYINPTFVTPETLKGFEDIIVYAPLHNHAHIAGMKACVELMPNTPQVSIFDTEFHQTMPPEEYIYAIPYRYYEDYKIRRYGAHGTSHKYVSIKAAEYMNKKDLNVITCHLGNGSSISAVKDGKCIATSMGFTPLAGVAMGTRSGDIDPAVLGFIGEKENLSAAELVTLLNKKSGVLGISGLSSDFRDLGDAAKEGNEKAKLAIDIFVHSVKKYIGSYAALLNGLDALVFTAGIGENSSDLREQICANLEFLGIEIDNDKNNTRGTMEINKEGAKVKVLVIPTNEELMIAKETMEMVKGH